MVKKKKTAEELQQDFENFKESDLGKMWIDVGNESRNFNPEPEIATIDIFEDQWRIFLNALYDLIKKFKIKTKEKFYDQNIVRTMFFEKPNLGPNQ